jgi:hypothetical protein
MDLKRMFVFAEWYTNPFNKKPKGHPIASLVYIDSFWIGIQEAYAVSKPLVKVLLFVDGGKPSMGYLYEAMDRAKEDIQAFMRWRVKVSRENSNTS